MFFMDTRILAASSAAYDGEGGREGDGGVSYTGIWTRLEIKQRCPDF
jgi:hypothetical protein